MKAILIDDEPLAIRRLSRLLSDAPVEVVCSFTDPEEAIAYLNEHPVDLLFLDIEMPGMTGFELLSRLDEQPLVIFTTAYDRYALRAFEVNSIDYLLKPVERAQLQRALRKIERIRGGDAPRPDLDALVRRLSAALANRDTGYPARIASRIGDRLEFVELDRVTHFFAKDKLTFAAAGGKSRVVDYTIAELEEKLDPARFVRIHRSTLLNLDYVKDLHTWFGGRLLVRLKDAGNTELTVARDRVRLLKEKLGL